MRRLWMSALLAPIVALVIPVAASAAPSAPAAPAVRAVGTASAQSSQPAGMTRHQVRELQRRLAALKYYPGPINGIWGIDTQEAVWAFQETQGLPGADYVSAKMEHALAHPRAPKVLDRAAGANRVEINIRDEVLVLYHNNAIELISHVSTGGHYYYDCGPYGCAFASTPTGNFRTVVFLPGWVTVPLGEMYNPVFFIGTAYAIHGDTDVPLQPVSHGCVRIPMDIAAFFHTLVKVPGEPVIIRD
jgi:lipoprotein-anchoring transpeptidase ErfK/SrfK